MAALWGFTQGASAESAFALPLPSELGTVRAQAFDSDGRPLPLARVSTQRHETGIVEIRFEAGQSGGARMKASALLEPVADGKALRLLEQHSASFTPDGRRERGMHVDHRGRSARCFGPSGDVVDEIALDARDRVVNVPMHLFFLPLVRGERERLEFEFLLCRDGARRLPFEAWVASTDDPRGVRVAYAPDYGVASIVARNLVPDLAFWFDPRAPHRWQGHRLPLYRNGPEVLIVRGHGPAAGARATPANHVPDSGQGLREAGLEPR